MLVIRLQRTGRENLPTYRVVVAERRAPARGKFLEIVGHYLPARSPAVFQPNVERIGHWVGKGAIPSETLARLLHREGVKGMDGFMHRYTKKRPKGETPSSAAPAAAATAVPAPFAAAESVAVTEEKSDTEAKGA